MKNWLKLSFLAALWLPLFGSAQSITNDWINPGQTYFKVTITEKGIYKVNFQDLNKQTNTDLSTVDPKHFQVFRQGEEQPISIETNGDGTFDQGDYIEFYGKKNDGTLDSGLYQKPKQQPQAYTSLFTDEAAYFITWNPNVNGERFEVYENFQYGQFSPEKYFTKENINTLTNEYNDGDPIKQDNRALNLSYYTTGESFASKRINWFSSKTPQIASKNHYKSGPNPLLEIKFIGDSKLIDDNAPTSNIRYWHFTRVQFAGNLIDTARYDAYAQKVSKNKLDPNLLSSNNTIRLKSLNPNDSLRGDYSHASYIKLRYPRNFKLNGNASFKFALNYNKPSFYIPFKQYGKNNPILYDLSNGKKIYGKLNNQQFDVIVPGSNGEQSFYLTDSTNKKTVSAEKVEFKDYQKKISNNTEFLIISNQKLSQSAKAYKNYRQSSGFNTELVYVNNLYNSFSYGIEHHPLSIRYLLEYLTNANKQPDYLLLLGKGIQNNRIKEGNLKALDLVPTFGQPPSDNLFVKNLEPAENINLAFPVGRIPANNNQEVQAYLNKLKDYENSLKTAQSMGSKVWRKNLLHVAGGKNKKQNQRFSNYLNNYELIAKRGKMGGSAELISKTKSIPSDKTQKQFVIDEVNKGVSLLTYFGHGAAEILEVDIGNPEDYTQNKGNYPVFLFSGCILGNTYQEDPSIAKDYLINSNKGGVAWLAESSFSFENYLNNFTRDFYKSFADQEYGNNLGDIFLGTIENFKVKGQNRDYLNEMQILQKTVQGDPALEIYGPNKPDYQVKASLLGFKPQDPNTELDSFALEIGVENGGKAINDSIRLVINQIFSDRTQKEYDPIQVKAPIYRDTFLFYIKPDEQKFAGNNTFKVNIKTTGNTQEVTKRNNSAEIEKFFPSNGITPLFPRPYSIVNERSVTLEAQSNNLFIDEADYKFQIDTTPRFNSPVKKSSNTIKANTTVKWQTTLLPADSTVYYWRIKRDNNDGQQDWNQSSFMFIRNSPKGWAQGHYNQFLTTNLDNLNFNSANRDLEFTRKTAGRFDIKSTGSNQSGFHIRYEGPRLFFGGAKTGIYILAINPNTHARFNYPSPYNEGPNRAPDPKTPKNDTSSGVYAFSWGGPGSVDTSIVEDFIDHVDSIPDGYTVIAFTADNHAIPYLPAKFYKAMEKLGSGKIRQIGEGWPYILLGKKGGKPQEVQEITADTSLPLDPKKQIRKAAKSISPISKRGEMTSTLIGPSNNWQDVFLTKKPVSNRMGDTSFLQVIGVDADGKNKVLRNNLKAENTHTIDSIDASQYPFLKLNTILEDSVNATPPRPGKWLVHYDYVPEGSLKPGIAYNFYKDSLQQGDSIRLKFAYQNISDFSMDSILVNYQIKDNNNQKVVSFDKRYKSLGPKDTLVADTFFSTKSLSGNYKLKLTINPDFDQAESFLFNNIITENFNVTEDNTNPALDVTFNGRHIMDGAIVSPQPRIKITSKDDNQYLLMDDTANMDILLKRPDGRETKLDYQDKLDFYPAENGGSNEATAIYQPDEKLDNGIYQLRVQSSDESGNQSGERLYEKNFEVIKESTITNLYPYPNPFTSRMRFVFTLTGSQIPDKINIQIMTIRGKVIKEIKKTDLGPLNIGVNKTNYVWHGNDEFGDPVGNGVYFYKVKAYLDGETIEHRKTAGDKFFKKGIGKLYLMR